MRAATTVLATEGMRGFTHRAVDTAASLPTGSTSYYFRTRSALLIAVVEYLASLDDAPDGTRPPPPADNIETVANLIAGMLWIRLSEQQTQTIARYELSLEARRRPELRARLEEVGASFRDTASTIMATLGSPEPERHGRQLVASCDGLIYDALVGAGSVQPPDRHELREAVRELLAGMLTTA